MMIGYCKHSSFDWTLFAGYSKSLDNKYYINCSVLDTQLLLNQKLFYVFAKTFYTIIAFPFDFYIYWPSVNIHFRIFQDP